MPEPFVRWGATWADKHPDWRMKLWTEPEVSALRNADLMGRCRSLAQRADVVRYEALFREGGVYLDTDMECLKNVEPLLEGLEFFACWQKEHVVSNAIFGCVPGHPIAKRLFEESRTEVWGVAWNSMGPPFFTPRVLSGAGPGVNVFERKTFIPYTRDEYKAFPKHPMVVTDPPPESYAINHRSSVWYADSTKELERK